MNECKYDKISTHKKQMKGLKKSKESYAAHIKRLLHEYEDDIE